MAENSQPRTVVKQTDKAVLYSDGTILVKDVRFSYPHIGTPYKGEEGKERYGVVGLMPKTAPYLPAKDLIRGVILNLIQEMKLPKGTSIAKKDWFLRNGDDSGRDEYKGMFEVHSGESRLPSARDNVRDPKTGRSKALTPQEADRRFYAGCWGDMLIRPWPQNNVHGKKVNAGLVAVQFRRDDEQFGQGRISEEDIDETFDEFADGESGFEDGLGEEDDL